MGLWSVCFWWIKTQDFSLLVPYDFSGWGGISISLERLVITNGCSFKNLIYCWFLRPRKMSKGRACSLGNWLWLLLALPMVKQLLCLFVLFIFTFIWFSPWSLKTLEGGKRSAVKISELDMNIAPMTSITFDVIQCLFVNRIPGQLNGNYFSVNLNQHICLAGLP